MAILGTFPRAYFFCILIYTLIPCTSSGSIGHDVLRRIENIEKFHSDLKKENFELRLEMADLQKQMDDITRKNRQLRDTVNDVKGWIKFEHSSFRMPYQHNRKTQKENSMSSVQRRIPPGTNLTERAVAFYAYFESYHGHKLPSHTTLVFDTIHINDGNGYSNDDGIFTAPRTGVYAFHWSITIDVHSWASVEIVVNGTPIGCTATDSESVNDWGTGSELVVTRVNTGDRVFLRMQENAVGYILSNSRARSSFSGWLLDP